MSNPAAPPVVPAPAAAPKTPQGLSPESLDQVIETTKPRGWWALIAIAVAVILVGIWACLANLPKQVSGQGVVSKWLYSDVVTSPVDGVVQGPGNIGSAVKKGDTIATVTSFSDGMTTPILASADGQLSSVSFLNGQGVSAGDQLYTLNIAPDPAQGIIVVAFLPLSDAIFFDVNQAVEVSVVDVASGISSQATATILSVGKTPSTLDSMALQSGSPSIAQEWSTEAGGSPYRVIVQLERNTTAGGKNRIQAGEVVQITNNYGTMHPIELLFGSG